MNNNDFRYMRRGKPLRLLSHQQTDLLSPIDKRTEGKQRALLLLHGFASSPAVYRHLLPALTRYDAVVCPALPGHAENIDSFAKTHASDWLSAVEATCETLVHEYEKVDVIGVSLGGLLACHLSNRFELNHLYLLAPVLALHLKLITVLKLANVLQCLGFKHLRNHAGNLHTDLHSELTYRQLPLSTIIEILTLVNEFQFIPPTCPIDLFLGRYDKVVDSSAVEKHFINLSNVTIHWLNNSAHVLPLDGDLDAIIACLNKEKIS